jgi:predicted DNA-binding transcriptional regulator AlpA
MATKSQPRPRPTPRRDVVDAPLMRRAIDDSGLTHRAIGEILGVSDKTIWRYANGRSHMELWAFPHFVKLIGLDDTWLAKAKKSL